MEAKKYLIGMDVGFATFGISIFGVNRIGVKSNDYEFIDSISISTKKSSKSAKLRVDSDNIRRICELTSQVDGFIRASVVAGIEWRKIFVAAEFPTAGTQNSKTAYSFGLGTGMLAAYLTARGIPFEHVTPDEVKIMATGRRQGLSKQDVERGIASVMSKAGISFQGKVLSEYLKNRYNKEQRTHVADSIAAAWWAKNNSNLYRAFLA